MPSLDVDGDRLHFVDTGAGVPCLLVHGSCGGAGQWKKLSSMLEAGHRVLAVDLFGAGDSEPWPVSRTWDRDDDTRALKALLAYIGEPVHVIMHSAGGQFCFPIIASHPDNFLSLTFYEPVLFQLLRHAGDERFEEPAGMAARYRQTVEKGDWDGAMRGFVDHWVGAGAWDGMPVSVRDLMNKGAGRLYHEWNLFWWDWPAEADLAVLDLPVLLVRGSETIEAMKGVCDLAAGALQRCTTAVLRGAGHMGPFTHAEDFFMQLQPHLLNHET